MASRRVVAFGCLSVPMDLTPEQQSALESRPALPPHTPPSLIKFMVFFEGEFRQCLAKNGYDPAKHFSAYLRIPFFAGSIGS